MTSKNITLTTALTNGYYRNKYGEEMEMKMIQMVRNDDLQEQLFKLKSINNPNEEIIKEIKLVKQLLTENLRAMGLNFDFSESESESEEELEAQQLEDDKERDAYYSQQYHELRHADYESEEEEE